MKFGVSERLACRVLGQHRRIDQQVSAGIAHAKTDRHVRNPTSTRSTPLPS
ncbi:hypothetical protein BIWAKO_05916 [Bosea sp. BIWAKO-01]|nr:hypothetical protein BIWAKO_05916 [Bosea sp. BIWAKO-01]